MKVTQLYTYPIKSLRSVPLTTAALTPNGFPHDRRFMLLKVHRDVAKAVPRSKSHLNGNLENMTVTYYHELALFLQSMDEKAGTFTVTYSPPQGQRKSLEIQLEPEVVGLEVLNVVLHQSPAKAFKMEPRVNAWFSECLGYEVILAYLGPNRRPVLGNLSPNAVEDTSAASKSWMSSITSSLPSMAGGKNQTSGITFADLAAYLVVTEESLQDVSSRLEDGTKMDMTKFRPNIVLSGSKKAYDEDYWAGISITSKSRRENTTNAIEIVLTQNCARCVSINVDYSTGKAGTGEAGKVLKKLMKDRRVDKGNKYSPIFGRYGFSNSADAGRIIAVGNDAEVSKVNQEMTTFNWPGMGT
ncbi:hypothetical protein P7C71_g4448, partial [Lecanoromycetidae sp. Uapishka_2]